MNFETLSDLQLVDLINQTVEFGGCDDLEIPLLGFSLWEQAKNKFQGHTNQILQDCLLRFPCLDKCIEWQKFKVFKMIVDGQIFVFFPPQNDGCEPHLGQMILNLNHLQQKILNFAKKEDCQSKNPCTKNSKSVYCILVLLCAFLIVLLALKH